VKYDLTGLFLEVEKIYYFYYNGQKKEEITYKDGIREIPNNTWFENGQKEEERNLDEFENIIFIHNLCN
tara:strand:- start:2883 stop:3089 length:207 start_codon:yes stop_codon:yes gene_type:complete